jgi:hypothetical protein
MSRLKPKTETLRALFARSGNQCAFPGCTQPLVNEKHQFVGQVCHIEAAMPGGERYNANSDDENRRSYENLMLFCYPHHIETDDIKEYSVERLTKIKNDHEYLFEKSSFKIDESELYKLSDKMEKYWVNTERINQIDHIFADSGLAMEVRGRSTFFDVINSTREAINGIEHLLNKLHESDKALEEDLEALLAMKGVSQDIFSDVHYWQNPFIKKNWELHNLGTPNWLQRIRINLTHIEVKYLVEYLKTNRDDLAAKSRLEDVKKQLEEYARSSAHVD